MFSAAQTLENVIPKFPTSDLLKEPTVFKTLDYKGLPKGYTIVHLSARTKCRQGQKKSVKAFFTILKGTLTYQKRG